MGRPTKTQTAINAFKKAGKSVENKTPVATDMFIPNLSGDHSAGHVKTPSSDEDIANKKYVDDNVFSKSHNDLTNVTSDQHHPQSHTLASHSTKAHSELTGVTSDQHHAQSHTVASHSDTTATGAELNTLTDNSMADSLHRHSELSASDGTPDAKSLFIDASGHIKIGDDPTFIRLKCQDAYVEQYVDTAGTYGGTYAGEIWFEDSGGGIFLKTYDGTDTYMVQMDAV